MRFLRPGALLVLAACASSPSTGGVAPVQTKSISVPIDGQNRFVTIHNEGGVVAGYAIAGAATRAWDILPQLYDDLGLSLTQIDSASRIVRGQRIRSHGAFMGHPLGDYLDCGATAGVPNVGRFEVDLYVASQLGPEGRDSTLVQTVVQAYAKPSGTAGEPSQCEANQKIAAGIAAALASALAQSRAPRP